MTDFQSTVKGDFSLGDGDLVEIDAADATGQHVVHRLRTFESEWFLNLETGIPYYRDILVKNPNPQLIDALFKKSILNSPEVLELLEFSMDYDNATRKLMVSFKVSTTSGEFETTEELL